MSILDRIRNIVSPAPQKDVSLQMAEIRKKLMELEMKFKIIIKKERNVVNSVDTNSARNAAQERLRNAYVSLRLVQIAQERLYDVSSTYELTSAMKELNKSLAVLNRMDKKNGKCSPALFLNWRAKKTINNKANAEEGGMKQFFDESIESILIGEDTMNKLVNTGMPIDIILKEDKETLENVDDFMGFSMSADNEFGDLGLSDDLDELINNLG